MGINGATNKIVKGPSSNSISIIKDMMAAGMTLARIKVLDVTAEDCHEMISNIRKANDAYSKSIGYVYPVPIALYLKGPDIRIGSLKDVIISKNRFLFLNSVLFSLKLSLWNLRRGKQRV